MKEFTFTLTETETNLILKGLGTLSLAESINVFNKIQIQAHEQLKANTDEKIA
jgi:hypothetical protein